MADLVDSYSEANYASYGSLLDHHPSDSVYFSANGQSFTCSETTSLHSVKFFLRRVSSPTGNGHAVLYAHSGTYGSGGLPTGPPLATSDDFDVSTLSTDFQLITFTFTGAQQYEMQAATKYVIVFENPATGTIDATNYVIMGRDNTSPTHSGNRCYYRDGEWFASTHDALFYVYGEAGGGVEHEHAASDTLSISDAVAYQMAFFDTMADTLTISDAVAYLLTIAQAFADTLGISDAVAYKMAFAQAFADTLGISDAVAYKMAFKAILADTMTISDAVSYVGTYYEDLADTLGISDAVAYKMAFKQSFADTLSISDAVAYRIFTQVYFTDTLSISDAMTYKMAFAKAFADTLGISDAVAYKMAFGQSFADTLSISDSVSYVLITPIQIPTEDIKIYR